jgi:hypothetical protein
MMVDSKIFSQKCMKKNIESNMKKMVLFMNTILLIVWLLISSNLKEDLSGHVKTMMEMFNLILLLKDLDL